MPQKPKGQSVSDAVNSLANTNIFKGVHERTLKRIAAIARRHVVDEGDVLYEMGDPVHDLYVVTSGRLRFTMGGGSRIEGDGSIIQPGDLLGWAALVADLPRRIASVVSLERSELLQIEGRALLGIFDEDPHAGYLVMQRLAKMITESFLEQSRRLSMS
jgi:CRP-like cAMP-binding protein